MPVVDDDALSPPVLLFDVIKALGGDAPNNR